LSSTLPERGDAILLEQKRFEEEENPHRILLFKKSNGGRVRHHAHYQLVDSGNININTPDYEQVRTEPERIPLCSFTSWIPGFACCGIWKSDLDIFGIGIGLYFRKIQVLFVLTLAYGILLLPISSYYISDSYSGGQNTTRNGTIQTQPVPFYLQGSAVCLDYVTVEVTVGCDSEVCYGRAADDCTLDFKNGVYSFLSVMVLFLCCILGRVIQTYYCLPDIDMSQQTSQDYSLVVNNPPDEDDPDVWKKFFNNYGQVAFVTIARANHNFLSALVRKKEADFELACIEQNLCTIVESKGKVELDPTKKFPVSRVFVTFFTEYGQRLALRKLGKKKFGFPDLEEKDKFQSISLRVEEAAEPSEIIWDNVHTPAFFAFIQGIVSGLLTLVLCVICFFYIFVLKKFEGSFFARFTGIGIALINSILPILLKWGTAYETHGNEGTKQKSLFVKLAAARFANTAIINFLTTNFSDTLGTDSLWTIQAILVADAIIMPTTELVMVIVGGFLNRQILCRFYANDKLKLRSFFGAVEWNIGERYTSITKTAFVALFYATIYPPGLLIAAVCFLYTYWVEKYFLLCHWKRPPMFSDHLSAHAHGLLMFSLLTHLLITANWYYMWPFDNTVRTDAGYALQNKNSITVDYRSWYRFFYVTPQPWHGEEQGMLVRIYGDASLIIFSGLFVYYLFQWFRWLFFYFWFGNYRECGDPQPQHFDTVPGIKAYVPMCTMPSNSMVGPLGAAFIDVDVDPIFLPHMKKNVYDEFRLPNDQAKSLFGIVKKYKKNENECKDEESRYSRKSRNTEVCCGLFLVVLFFVPVTFLTVWFFGGSAIVLFIKSAIHVLSFGFPS